MAKNISILKNLLIRLSGSLFESVSAGLRTPIGKRHAPSLKLVSHNPNLVASPDLVPAHLLHSTMGHAEALGGAIRRGQAWALSQQDAEKGYWVYELEADTTLTSEYLMLRRFLGLVDVAREQKAVFYLRHTQLEDGGWSIYKGGPSEISASVKGYFALKLAGIDQEEPFMQRARDAILSKGGVVAANVFTKITLALFGQYDWRGIPSMPPEIILAPKRFYFNVYALSYWTRAVLIPLLVVFAYKPKCCIPEGQGINELFLQPRNQVRYRDEPPFQKDSAWASWRNFFVWLDGALKVYEQFPIKSLRKKALKKAEAWLIEHMNGEGGLGAIYPAMANSIFALHALGYQKEHPKILKALKEIETLEVETSLRKNGQSFKALHMQPCLSPVWDTALMISALVEQGLPLGHPALREAALWLRSCQTTHLGDWVTSSSYARSGGWAFQFENAWYPDVDDTAAVVIALAKLAEHAPANQDEAIRRGTEWVLALQGSDGGWGSYDKDNNRLIFNKIPFADHQALLDPSTADLAGRCLEMLGTLGCNQSHPAVGPALEFLQREQEADGSWYGRWGVNYIYGTWCVMSGLRAIGENMSAPWIQKAVMWIESKQNVDGGWGESCWSYADRSLAGKGESTPSQTSWAIMALLAAGVSDSLNVVRGINFLLRHQREDGTWHEEGHTGTGFPRVFYLRYHGYCQYFPMWALAMYQNIRTLGLTKADELRQIAKEKQFSRKTL